MNAELDLFTYSQRWRWVCTFPRAGLRKAPLQAAISPLLSSRPDRYHLQGVNDKRDYLNEIQLTLVNKCCQLLHCQGEHCSWYQFASSPASTCFKHEPLFSPGNVLTVKMSSTQSPTILTASWEGVPRDQLLSTELWLQYSCTFPMGSGEIESSLNLKIICIC